MKKVLLSISLFGSFLASAQNCSELFISEYVEGSGNDKALELYNPTANAISLTGYRIERFSNGNSTSASGGVLNLSGSVAPYSTFVITNGQTATQPNSPAASPALQALAQQLDGVYPAPTYMNGNDAIVLYKNTTIVDIFGKTGDASMTSSNGWSDVSPYDGSVGAIWTENHTLVRKPGVKAGVSANPSVFIVTTEWDSLPKDTWTGLGAHTCECLVGIDELTSTTSYVVYPNPSVDGQFTVTASEKIEGVQIIDMLGQVVFKEEYAEITNNKMIDAAALPKGFYTVRIRFNNQSISQTNFVIK